MYMEMARGTVERLPRRRLPPVRFRLPVARIPGLAGGFAMLVGGLVLVAWILGLDGVKRLLPGLPQMKANTALALVALGGAVLLLREGRSRRHWTVGHGLALVVALFGALVLAEYLAGGIGIDQLLFHDPGPTPGRPAPHTAVAFVLVGLALAILDRDPPRYRPSTWLLLMAALVVLSALVGYVYGVDFLRATSGTTGIALHTALALAAVVIGGSCLRPDRGLVGYLRRDDIGAATARQMLPAALVVPLCLGLLGRGVQGLGFDARADDGVISLTTICVLVALVLVIARRLSNSDDQRRVAERSLRRLATIVDCSEDAIVSVAPDGTIETWNDGATRLFGYTAEEVIGSSSATLIAPERRAEAADVFAGVLGGFPVDNYETRALTNVGRRIDIALSGSPIRNGDTVTGAASVVRDVTERRQAQLAAARLAAVVGASHDAIMANDLEGIVMSWNPGAERLYGYAEAEMVGKSISELVPEGREDEVPAILARVRAGGLIEERDTVHRRSDGLQVDVSVTVSPIRGPDGTVIGSSTIARDITTRLHDEQRLRFLAEHDPLTGARNRRSFEQAISESVARARRYDENAVLLILDINDFKQINDTYGHLAGDDALKQIAAAITQRLRDTDVIARIGGDEFAILLPHGGETQAETVANDLQRLIEESALDVGDGRCVSVSISVGIALIDKHTISDESAFAAADHAMYQAKRMWSSENDSPAGAATTAR